MVCGTGLRLRIIYVLDQEEICQASISISFFFSALTMRRSSDDTTTTTTTTQGTANQERRSATNAPPPPPQQRYLRYVQKRGEEDPLLGKMGVDNLLLSS